MAFGVGFGNTISYYYESSIAAIKDKIDEVQPRIEDRVELIEDLIEGTFDPDERERR